tara:strand:+ start:754 stop:1437 length:684 start_codon:yes stop_codon:yes gene_type:complete
VSDFKNIKQSWRLVTNIEEANKNSLNNTEVLAAIKSLRIVFEEISSDEIRNVAAELNETETKIQNIYYLTRLKDEEIQDLLKYTKDLEIMHHISGVPKSKRKTLLKGFVGKANRKSVIPNIITIKNNLNEKDLIEVNYPFIAILEKIDKHYFKELSKDSKNWMRFSDDESKKIEKFYSNNNPSVEEWKWLFEILKRFISKGNISSNKGVYQKEIIDIFKEADKVFRD